MAAKAKSKKNPVQEELTRVAIVNSDRCKPKKCKQECKKWCPVNRMGKILHDYPLEHTVVIRPPANTVV